MIALSANRAAAGSVALTGAGALMDVILHVGAHFTGSRALHRGLREGAGQRLGYWEPARVSGMTAGLLLPSGRDPKGRRRARGAGRVRLNLRIAEKHGIDRLVVSQPDAIGTPAQNLRSGALYPAAGEMLSRLSEALGDSLRKVVLSVRSPELWWNAALNGRSPSADRLDRLVTHPRSWRAVISDMACAAPQARLLIAPHERFGDRPHQMAAYLTGRLAPRAVSMAPKKVPAPVFTPAQAETLRAVYAEDLNWLRAGADGLATLIEETGPARRGLPLPDRRA